MLSIIYIQYLQNIHVTNTVAYAIMNASKETEGGENP